MKMRATAIAAALALLAPAAMAPATENPVGYTYLTIPAVSDVLVSVPFIQAKIGSFTVTAVDGAGVTVADTLPENAYNNVFYVRFTSGAGIGRWATVTTNTASKFNIGTVAGVAVDDTFDLIPHQTLANTFPDEHAGLSFIPSTNTLGSGRRSEVLILGTAPGVNKSASDIYYFFNNEWRKSGTSGNFDNVVLPPQTYFILRNPTASPLTFLAEGCVQVDRINEKLAFNTIKNDNSKAAMNAVPVTLRDLRLTADSAAFVPSTNTLGSGRRDELVVFDNTSTGFNKSASAVFYIQSTTLAGGTRNIWRKNGASGDFSNEVVSAGAALLIRKYQQGSDGTVEWKQQPATE